MALWFWGLGSHKDTRVTWRRWGRGGFFGGRWWRFRWCRFWSQSTGLTRLEKRIGGERNEVFMQEGTIHTESELLRTQRRGCGGRVVDVNGHQSFLTWRWWVRGGLVDLGRFAVEGSASHDHVVVPRERVHVVDVALPVACDGQVQAQQRQKHH